MSNELDLDHVRHFVRPDLDPNWLQKLSADDTIELTPTWNASILPSLYCTKLLEGVLFVCLI